MKIDNLRRCIHLGEQFYEAMQEFDVYQRNPYCTLQDDLTFLRIKLSKMEKEKLASYCDLTSIISDPGYLRPDQERTISK